MSLFQKACELQNNGVSFVIVTMINSRGGAPQDPGAKAIITQEGLEAGTIGGGKVEAAAIELSKQELQEQKNLEPKTLTWNLQKDIGMTCGGEVTFLFEYFYANSWPIIIFGAGHVSQALTRTLKNLNCQLTCVDPRGEWIEKLDSSTTAIHSENPAELVKNFSSDSFFISMTKGHAFDVPILAEIAKHHPNCPYVGVIGSKTKGSKIKAELKEMGISDDFLEKLKVPIGLPLGTNDPYEISISIVAELIQVRDSLKKPL